MRFLKGKFSNQHSLTALASNIESTQNQIANDKRKSSEVLRKQIHTQLGDFNKKHEALIKKYFRELEKICHKYGYKEDAFYFPRMYHSDDKSLWPRSSRDEDWQKRTSEVWAVGHWFPDDEISIVHWTVWVTLLVEVVERTGEPENDLDVRVTTNGGQRCWSAEFNEAWLRSQLEPVIARIVHNRKN